ncbi:MAG TPA: YhjD/YihY/BrkB family envelope integrity protein, partial [Myxococcales bacterium]|nr:YhjD/YihY/BrkB family envelope integrity protein [Myxococcales bacterium]
MKSTLVHTGHTLRTTSGGRFAADTMSAMRAVALGFRGKNISLRASALTYATIFSLVPMLTVALAILQSLHQDNFQANVRSFVQGLLAPGIREDTGALLERFISRATGVAAGWIGFIVLAVTAGALLHNLDASLNEIWNVRQERKLWLRHLAYAVLLLLGPLMMAISLAGSSELRALMLKTQLPYTRTLVALSPWLTSVFAFTLLYKVAPAAAVRLRSAFAGALLAGLGWQIAQRVFSAFGAQIFRFNPIYGSLGAAPLFLGWIYVSWLIVLFGARLAYAIEHASYLRVYGHLGDTPRTREMIAAQIARQVTLAHFKGQPAPTVKDLARKLDVPLELAGYLVEKMLVARLLKEVGRAGLIPARPPEEISLADASRAVGGTAGLQPLPLSPDKAA